MVSSFKARQLSLLDFSPEALLLERQGLPFRTETLPDFNFYDKIIIALSGGKDSLAIVLYLLWLGVPVEKIELWHHLVDGQESTLMDWRCTEAYCKALAAAFHIPLYLSWKEGGFERELQRDNSPSIPGYFETPEGLEKRGGGSTKTTTRRRFPQTGSIQDGRWCSAILKIDLGDMALRNQDRFKGKRILFVTGERRDESKTRAKYAAFEPHSVDARNSEKLKRHVDHWRPVIGWDEVEIWRIIKQFSVNPHPCYRLGFGRCSCRACIFASDDQLATLRLIDPAGFERIAAYETQFCHTIHRTLTVNQRADQGTPYSPLDPMVIASAFSTTWDEPIILPPGKWTLPMGAFGESNGPT